MRVGDVLEWLAGLAFVVAAYLVTVGGRAWLPVLVAGVFLGYQAQCWAAHPVKLRPRLPKIRLRLPRRKRSKP